MKENISKKIAWTPKEVIGELLYIAKFLYGFLPWIMFLFLPTHSWEQLKTAVAICTVASIVFGWSTLRKGFILQWVSTGFFLFCTISFYAFKWIGLAEHMGIVTNSILSGIIWLTILVGKPFTLQYAREELPREQWDNEDLVASCLHIAVFWGTLLLVPVIFSIIELLKPGALPESFFFYLSIVCIVIGTLYTSYYKRKVRRRRALAQ